MLDDKPRRKIKDSETFKWVVEDQEIVATDIWVTHADTTIEIFGFTEYSPEN
ncbi:hypothetical protein [Pseudomonas sp. LB3P31]